MNCKIPFLGMLALAFLNGCGGGSSSGPQPILVVLSTPPPSSIVAGGTATVSATVSNDTAAKGVTWNCAPAGTCGSFSPMSTASGASTTYTAPASSPSGGMVTITASSVTDGTKSASATVTIPGTASKATLKGQYVFFITAPTGNRKAPAGTWGTTTFVGSVTVDGAGNITGAIHRYAADKGRCAPGSRRRFAVSSRCGNEEDVLALQSSL